MAAKSALVRAAKREAAARQPEPPPLEAEMNGDAFVAKHLESTRTGLEKLHRLFAAETDPRKLAALSRAIVAMAECERTSSGRPGPGVYRPDKPMSKSTPGEIDKIASLDPQQSRLASPRR